MSYKFSNVVWGCRRYAGGTLLVLLALADWSNDDGVCWPSVPTIAERTRLGTRHVYNILRRLRADGILSIELPGGGRGVHTRYKLDVHQLSVKPNSVNPISVKHSSQQPCTSVQQTMNHGSQNGELYDNTVRKNRHEPPKEPSVEPSNVNHPTLEDVAVYCRARGSRIDPEQWLDYYTSNGWKVGRNPMKDWKASVRYWERNRRNNNGNRAQKQQQASLAALESAFPMDR